MTRRNITIAVGVAAALLIGAALLGAFGVVELPRGQRTAGEPDENLLTSRSAYDMAREKAREWKSDAVLAFIGSGSVSSRGRAETWEFIFVSKTTKGKGFQIKVVGQNVASAQEITYTGFGAEFPSDIISPEEAIAIVRAMPGYETVEILGVEAVYGPREEVWYWGVKTAKGVVSVEAKKR